MFQETIKSTTNVDHKNAEKHSYGREIMEKTLTLRQYTELVVANYMYISSWEKEWQDSLVNVEALNLNKRAKISLLLLDLKELGIDPATISCVALAPALTKAQFYGRMYVIEGSTLGGAMISKQLQLNPNLTGLGFHFYKGYGPLLMPNWKEFLAELNTLETKEEQDEAIAWAKQAFNDMENCFINAKAMSLHS